jgi:hypothetical protein
MAILFIKQVQYTTLPLPQTQQYQTNRPMEYL